jgi:predicted TIM-barrel fold metal-dependent hydrolase
MAVIDVDTHFEPGRGWLDDRPDLAARLPEYSVADATMRAQVGELLALVPEAERPPVDELLPPQLAAILGQIEVEGYGFAGSAMHSPCDPTARLGWMDENGISVANVLCLEGASYARTLEDRAFAREVITACNTWLAAQVDGHQDRLMPATALELSDVDWAVGEMTRMRARGSRSFLIGPLPAPGKPAMHPDFEPVWAAAEDLGMMCEVHVGSGGNAFDPSWARHPDTMVLRQLGAAGGWQAALLMLNGMVFGGVFDRHPNLTLLFAEYGLHWFAGAVEHMEARGPAVPESAVYMGRYPNELTPEETVRRNVRITPLPRRHQPVPRTLDLYPECVVFSSDYAHNESNPEPTAYYDEQLAGVDPARKAWFLGANIAECFARTGDPLPV